MGSGSSFGRTTGLTISACAERSRRVRYNSSAVNPAMDVVSARHLENAKRALARWLRRGRSATTSLRTTVGILKAQQEATIDGILVVDNDGRVLSYNRRFLEIWQVPPDVAASADDNELLGYAAEQVTHWDYFIEVVNYLYQHPEDVRTNDP